MKLRSPILPMFCMGTFLLGSIAQSETVILEEDFESYSNDGELFAVWNAGAVSYATYTLDTDVGNGGNSYRMSPPEPANNFQARVAINLPGGPIQATNDNPVEFSMDFKLDDISPGSFWNGARHYIELRGYANGTYLSGDLENLIAIGVNNASGNPFSTTFYQGRVTFGVNWQTLNTEAGAPQRTVGWHKLTALITGDQVVFSVDDIVSHIVARPNNFQFDSVVLGAGLTSAGHTAWVDNIKVSILDAATPVATIEDAFVYHNDWGGQGSPVDAGKSLHKEGATPETLTFENLINTARGINGIGFDIQGLADAGALSESDFELQVSPQGAFSEGGNPPSGWAAAPAPSSVTVAPGVEGAPDQVLILWPDNSIENRWLRVTVKASTNTGLAEDEVYYIGHLRGETTGPTGSVYTVAFADITPIRSAVGQTVDASSVADIDKNGIVNFADISAMRSNVGAQLTNVTVPEVPPAI